MSLLHPTRRRIRTWLDSGDVDAGLETHLDHCVRCSDELESLAGEQVSVELALAEMLAPPADLGVRMEQRIAASFQARRDLELMAQMFGLSAQVTRLLLEPPDDTSSPD